MQVDELPPISSIEPDETERTTVSPINNTDPLDGETRSDDGRLARRKRTGEKLGRLTARVRYGREIPQSTELSSGPTVVERSLDAWTSIRKYEYPDREVITISPGKVGNDPSTNKPLAPLLFVQGMGQDRDLEQYLTYFAKAGQREVIGVRHVTRKKGVRTKRIDVGLPDAVPHIDHSQAQDLLRSLSDLGVDKVDLVGLSRGAIRTVETMARLAATPETPNFEDVLLLHPGGQDKRSYTRRHIRAARLGVRTAHRRWKYGQVPGGETTQTSPLPRQSLRSMRREQKSMARAHMNRTLASIPLTDGQSVTIAGGRTDPAVRSADLRKAIINPTQVDFIETDWPGTGHGFGDNPAAAIREISDYILQKKRKRAESI
ncbi:MAG TPA: alpha/beta hydrolase [Candidatus Saccharimonadales bacterium]|nr:alpha/beta hydrolase [Candidatus Saccharimonadales bacterium]